MLADRFPQARRVHDVPPPLPDDLHATPAPAEPDTVDHAQWQPLPRRGAYVAGVKGALGMSVACLFALGVFGVALQAWQYWPAMVVAVLLAAGLGAWLALKRHRLTRWKLDNHGLACSAATCGRAKRESRSPACSIWTCAAARSSAPPASPRWWCIPRVAGSTPWDSPAWTSAMPNGCATASPTSSTTTTTPCERD